MHGFEDAREVERVPVAHLIGDLFDGQVGSRQQLASPAHAGPDEPVQRRITGHFSEQTE